MLRSAPAQNVLPRPRISTTRDVVVVLGALERRAELGQQPPVDAVLDLGPVQPDRGDAVGDLVLHELLGRGAPFVWASRVIPRSVS